MIEVLEEDLSTERKIKLESIAFSTNPILSATPLRILTGKKVRPLFPSVQTITQVHLTLT